MFRASGGKYGGKRQGLSGPEIKKRIRFHEPALKSRRSALFLFLPGFDPLKASYGKLVRQAERFEYREW